MTDKPLHHIVARPDIKSIAELRGKRIGAQRIGGSDQLAPEAILQAKGLHLKEVQFVTLGADEPVRAEMLRKGLVDAICVAPPGPNRLMREGFNVLGGPKDLKVGSPISAVSATDSQIGTKRDETKYCGPLFAGCASFTSARKKVIPIMVKWLNQTPEVARDSYDSILPSFSPDGGNSDKTYEFAVDARRATVKADKIVPLSQVRDNSLLREVQKELRLR